MSLRITTAPAAAPYEHVSVMRLEGRTTLSEGVRTFCQAINDQKPGTNLLLDMTGMSYADGIGIGELVSARSNITNQGGALKMFGLQKRPLDLTPDHKALLRIRRVQRRGSGASFLRPAAPAASTSTRLPRLHFGVMGFRLLARQVLMTLTSS